MIIYFPNVFEDNHIFLFTCLRITSVVLKAMIEILINGRLYSKQREREHCLISGSIPSAAHNSNLTFLLAPCFTSIENCQPYMSLVNSPAQLYRKSPAIQQLATLPKLHPPTSCSGSLTSSTLSPRYVNFPYCFHFFT